MENEQLKSFIAYCEQHPEERFWQALRNWSGSDAVYRSVRAGEGVRVMYEDMPVYLKDTYQE